MTDHGHWTCPPDRPVHGWGEYTVTVLRPPFPAGAGPGTAEALGALPPHDPVAARRFAESFGTVECVLDELYRTDTVVPLPRTRADLDVVHVGCWGGLIGLSDPALADNGNQLPLLAETEALHRRFPDARIVGSVGTDMGAHHSEDTVHLPTGLALHSEGWDSTRWDLTGDPHALLHALGIRPESLAGQAAELHPDDPAATDWQSFGRLALGPWDPWGRRTLQLSAFRVRHTAEYTDLMEEIWRFDD
ncbi:DUF6333 family protein [Kitasatospora sp. NPDC054939]